MAINDIEKQQERLDMKYIELYREGERLNGIYLCKSKMVLKTKAGKTYYSVLLQDKTGTLDSKIWDLNGGIDDFDSMDFVMVDGSITSFQGNLQGNISRLRKASEGEYDQGEYFPVSRFDIETMYSELTKFIMSIGEPHLRALTESYFTQDTDFIKRFKQHSAAKSVHHGFIGGLLEHTLSVTRLCDFFAAQYDILDRDLLITAAIFHDIGKVYELSGFPENEYTDEGQLLGHIFLGAEIVGNRIQDIPGFPAKLANELRHCILAHHGELEYGSPKKPALAEAMALNFADNADAKMETMREIFAGADAGTQWLGFNRIVESNVRRSSGSLK